MSPSSSRMLSTIITTVLLAACSGGDGDSNSGGNNGFSLSGNLQTFSGILGTPTATSTSPTPLTINGRNLSWQASSTVPWIQLQATSGTGAGVLPFTVNPTGLSEGANEGTIRVTDSTSGVTLNATVSVTLRPLGFIVTPTTLTLNVDSTTTSVDPPAFTVSDELNGQSGAAAYNWRVTSPSPYVTATPAQGTTATTTTVNVGLNALNAVLSGGYSGVLTVAADGPGAGASGAGATVTVNATVQLPRAHAVYPHIIEPGTAVVKLIGRNFQQADVARLRVNGAAPVGATFVSDRVIDVNLGTVAAGQYVFTFDNPLGLSRSVAELTVTPRAPAAGSGEIVSNRRRQRIAFDSHRGVLYATNIEEGALQRFTYDGANWQELSTIAVPSVSGIDFSSNARVLYAAGSTALWSVDISQPTPVVTNLKSSSLLCGGIITRLHTVAAPPIGSVHGYPLIHCRIAGTGTTIDAVGYDQLLGGEVLPYRDTFPNDDAESFWDESGVMVSGDRRYVATTTSLWDSQTGTFAYSSLTNTQSPQAIDLRGTKILLGATVVDRTGTSLCTLPLDPDTSFARAAALSADGSRIYFYQPGAGASEIRVLSTAQSGTPASPGACATAAAAIPVADVGASRPDQTIYGSQPVYSMAVSDDDNLLFLSGSSRIVAIDLP